MYKDLLATVKLSLTNLILVADGITLTLEFIAMGEPLVQRGNLGFHHSVFPPYIKYALNVSFTNHEEIS